MSRKKMTRRRFLGMSAAAAAGAIVSACGPAPTPEIREIEKEVEVTREVATEVTKEVEVLKEVEVVVTTTPPPAKYPPGTLTLWSWGTPQYQEDYMNDFLLTHYPNAGITGEALGQGGSGDIKNNIIADWAAGCGTCPDFAQSSETDYRPMAKAGAALELTPWVDTFKHKMPDGIFDLFTIDSKVWCFPWRPNTWIMYYNREVFDKAGIKAEDIETWDDWMVAGVEIRKATNGESYLEYRDGGSLWHTASELVPMAGGRYFDESYNVVIDKDPATIEVFMMLEDLHKNDLLYHTSSWNPGWYQAMRDGKFAAMHYGNWWDEFLKKNLPDMSGKWGLMPIPAFSNGNHKASMKAVPFVILNKPDAPYIDLVMELLEWQFLDEQRVVEYLNLMTNRALTAFLPVLKDVYDDPFFSSEDPYYGGQSFQGFAVESTRNTPPPFDPTLDGSGLISGVIDGELAKVYEGEQGMEEALMNMANGLEEQVEAIMEAREE